jgi:hypothetical protein
MDSKKLVIFGILVLILFFTGSNLGICQDASSEAQTKTGSLERRTAQAENENTSTDKTNSGQTSSPKESKVKRYIEFDKDGNVIKDEKRVVVTEPSRILTYKQGDPVPAGYSVRVSQYVDKVKELHFEIGYPTADARRQHRVIEARIEEDYVLVPKGWEINSKPYVILERDPHAFAPTTELRRTKIEYASPNWTHATKNVLDGMGTIVRAVNGGDTEEIIHVYNWDNYPNHDLDKYRPAEKIHNMHMEQTTPPNAPPLRPPAKR